MAPAAQEPEITLAQRLASNDKPIRTKALKTLRKYINLRSQKVEGGFTSEDLLKIWKGLFYCLWMQDKPLLQEEISQRISGLIQSFHTTEYQLLYFSTFLQTVKREWNGIDRLRMDKFFQLVRFMFRQVFEALRRMEWDSSVVNRFLQVFTEQILQNPDQVPKGLLLHVLDLYMTELALVGSAELTADQNMTFIGPFCKTLAKTKDRMLLTSVSKNIFMTIVEHAPYAIEDLMKELEQQGGGEDSDSGQASGEEDDEEEVGGKKKLKNKTPKKTSVKVTGVSEELENSLDELDEDRMGSEEDDDMGPVLQFDYGAIADHLFELGSHLNTRNINRAKMYRLVKIFRDLGEGVFSQNEDNNRGVKNSSDAKMFNKKKSKNKQSTTGNGTLAKKSKACQDEQKPSDFIQDDSLIDGTENPKPEKRDKEYVEPDTEKAADTFLVLLEAGKSDTQSQREAGITLKKKRKSKKPKTNSQDVGEGVADELQSVLEETDGELQAERRHKRFKTSAAGSVPTCTDQKVKMSSHAEIPVEAGQAECDISLVKEKTKKKRVKDRISLHGHSAATATKDDEAESPGGDHELGGSVMVRKKKRKSQKLCFSLQEDKEVEAVQSLPKEHNDGDEIRKLTTSHSPNKGKEAARSPVGTSATQKKKKRKKSCLQEAVKSPAVCEDAVKHNDDEISRHPCPASEEDGVTCATTKKKRKSKKLMSSLQEVNSASQDSCAEVIATDVAASAFGVTHAEVQPSDTPRTNKSKKKKAKEETGSKHKLDLDVKEPISKNFNANGTKETAAECSQPKPEKRAKKKKLVSSNEEESVLEAGKQSAVRTHTVCKKKKTQKKQESQLAEEARVDAILKKPVSKKAGTEVHDAVLSDDICTPEVQSLTTPMKPGKRKRKLQADETEASQSNGHAEEQVRGMKVQNLQGIDISISATPKKLKMDKAATKSDFVSFQAEVKTPTPLFCKTRPRVSTPLSMKQIFLTPKSESKKVTFGLRNNKTAEFRKTDSSLLVSPVGSSRVAFDPKKKPVSGVLKSPSLSPFVSMKKTAFKKRATAADFF